jgi:hypothetical protein
LPHDSKDVFSKDILYYYLKRPIENQLFTNICLADFVSEYNIVNYASKKNKLNQALVDESELSSGNDTDDSCNETAKDNGDALYDSDNENDDSNNLPKLFGINKFLEKRRKPKIIRYAHFNIHQSPEDYYREQCMLFLGWQNEEKDLLKRINKDVYFENQLEIEKIKKKYIKFENENLIEEIERDKLSYNEENESDDSEKEGDSEYAFLNSAAPDIDIFQTMGKEINSKDNMVENFKIANQMLYSDYEKLILSFNKEQRKFFYHVMTNLKNSEEQFFLFCDGQAGVGKTCLIRGLIESINRYYNLFSDNDLNLPKVLVCAYTGKACSELSGCCAMTLHTAFGLPIDIFSGDMPTLGQSVGNSLFTKLKLLKVLFIDEISMVGGNMFNNVNKRCQQIFRNKKFFGGLSLIVTGQFYQLPQMFDHRIFSTGKELMQVYKDQFYGNCLNILN